MLVGDVHGQWDPILDEAALRLLNPDAAIFVGKLCLASYDTASARLAVFTLSMACSI